MAKEISPDEEAFLKTLAGSAEPAPWQEACARKLTATLNRQPRRKKTRDYVKTLPKRSPIVVSPAEFAIPISRKEARETGKQAIRDAQRYAEWERKGKRPSPTIIRVRKDRVRPRAASGFMPSFADIVWDQANGICAYCQREMIRSARDGPMMFTLDHVLPRSRGGKHELANLVAAHKSCNNEKGSLTGDEYRAVLAARR